MKLELNRKRTGVLTKAVGCIDWQFEINQASGFRSHDLSVTQTVRVAPAL